MILPAEIRLGADKRGKGRQQEGRGEGAKEGRKVPNCEVSHTWRRWAAGQHPAPWLLMMVTQWRRRRRRKWMGDSFSTA